MSFHDLRASLSLVPGNAVGLSGAIAATYTSASTLYPCTHQIHTNTLTEYHARGLPRRALPSVIVARNISDVCASKK